MVQVSTSNVLDLEDVVGADYLATFIATRWRELNEYRSKWIEERKELRNYLFATDTRTTSNSRLEWSNSTTTPKLTQIRDNLHANYMANLFPNSNYLTWKGVDEESQAKADIVTSYMKNKLVQSNFLIEASKLVSDYIDYGNVFAKVDMVNESIVVDGEVIPGYVGPKVTRISPHDIVFDPTAATFEGSPKIIKQIVGLGDIKKAITDNPAENQNLQMVFDKMIAVRNLIRTSDAEIHKSEGFVADGFSNITMYYDSEYVELLTFYGNIYDKVSGEYMVNREITIADRAYVIDNKPIPSWLGVAPIRKAGWRDRPDNLYSMGPLDNLVGLQYRMDHMENMKADVWDMIAYPQKKVRGDVEDWDEVPGERIYVGDEGDVDYLHPDATVLTADQQIERIQFIMEEMAGAPRQAMGFRTPGEKTAFEVDSLMNAANRIFRHKSSHLEQVFFEPLFNDMLETGRRNLVTMESVEVVDAETGGTYFEDITREDISAGGRIVPIAARHFAERDTRIQNLMQMSQLKADPSIGVHFSGKKIAEIMSDELNEPALYSPFVALEEEMEMRTLMEDAAVEFEAQQQEIVEEGF